MLACDPSYIFRLDPLIYTPLRYNFSVVMPLCFKMHRLWWNNRSNVLISYISFSQSITNGVLEELKHYLKIIFKHLYDDVFSKDNRTMKTEKKLTFTEKRSKFILREFIQYQFLWPMLIVWNFYTAKIKKFYNYQVREKSHTKQVSCGEHHRHSPNTSSNPF